MIFNNVQKKGAVYSPLFYKIKPMERIFKSLSNEQIVDLVPYIKKKLEDRNDISIYIGCDSQTFKNVVHYACVVVLHYNKSGGHILYTDMEVPLIKERFTRLWKEVEISVEVAEYLRANGIEATFIDIDLNPDPYYGSNNVLRSALGFVESFGYSVRCKPYSVAATYCADKLCK